MRRSSVVTGSGNSPKESGYITLDGWKSGNVGVFAIETGTCTYTIQISCDDVSGGTAPSNWFTMVDSQGTSWSGLTDSKIGMLEIPATAMRIAQTAGNGSGNIVTLVVIESP